jgi:GT2 family glycosyltransferase/SAM-dependent methyltransferase
MSQESRQSHSAPITPDAERAKWDAYYASLPAIPEHSDAVSAFDAELCDQVLALLPEGGRILEAGSGSGSQSLALARTGQFQVSLMDFSAAALEHARRLFADASQEAEFIQDDVLTPGQPDYDLVFNAGVLEHYPFEQQVAIVRGMASRSRRYVLVLAPNRQCYWYWLWRVQAAGRGAWPFGAEAPLSDLAAVFEGAGLRLLGQTYLAAAWTEQFIDSLAGLDPALKDEILAIHRSAILPPASTSYLLAALGSVVDAEDDTLPPVWQSPGTLAAGDGAETGAALADALAVRLAADHQINQLTAQAHEREVHMRTLMTQRQEQEHHLHRLTAQLGEQEQRLHILTTRLDEQERIAAEAERRLRDREHELADLEAQLDIRTSQVTYLETHTAEQTEGIEWLQQEIAQRDASLEAIYRSRLWQAANHYWRVRRRTQRLSRLVRGGPRTVAFAVGRRVLPTPAKRLIRQFWQPVPPTPATPATLAPPVDVTAAPAPRPSAYDIICFAIIDWDFRWQRPQQIMSRFAEQGHRVFFISPTRFLPIGRERYHARPLRDNVWEVHLALPRAFQVYSGELPASLVKAMTADLADLAADFNINCAVSVVQTATWAPAALEVRRRFGWWLVYDCMDEWNTFPGIRPALLVEERRLVAETDLLVVSGQRLWEKWSPHNANTVLARNASDFDHFHTAPTSDLLAEAQRPIVGYFGAIADWFDLDLMVRLARERPQYTFVLIGGIFDVPMAALETLPNVQILGQQPYERMPAYLRQFDACIIPFKVNAITEATDPVKFYEYISQGKPVVAPRMPELYPYREYLYIADDHDDFLCKVDQAVAEDDPDLCQRRIELARANTWQARLTTIKDGIKQSVKRASVIVVTYNNLDYTRQCLESVLRDSLYPNLEVIVVDNASTDGTPDYLQALAAEHDHVTIILNQRNAGFAAANNQGLAAAGGDYLILLNNDTVVPSGWLARMTHHLDQPELGLVGSVTNFAGNEAKIPVSYTELEEMETFAARYTHARQGQCFDIQVAAMYCVGLRREVFERVGPLDEQFSVGMFEDDDYSHRVRLAGYRVVCAEDVFVHHYGQTSFKKLSPSEYQVIWDRNQRLFEQKWGVRWQPHQGRTGN